MKHWLWKNSGKSTAANEKNGSIFEKFLFYLVFGCVLTSVIAVLVYLFAGASVHARRIADEMLPRAESMSRLATRLQSGQIAYDSFLDFTLKEQQGTRVYIFDENATLIAYTTENQKMDEPVSQSILDEGAKVVKSGEQFVSTKWRSTDGVVVGVPITDNLQRVTGAILMSRSSYEVYSSLMSFVRALMLSSLSSNSSSGVSVPMRISTMDFTSLRLRSMILLPIRPETYRISTPTAGSMSPRESSPGSTTETRGVVMSTR